MPSAAATAARGDTGTWQREVVGDITFFFCAKPAACGRDAKVSYRVYNQRQEPDTLDEFRQRQRSVIGMFDACGARCEGITARLDDARLRKSGPYTILTAYRSETQNGKSHYALSGLVFGPKRWLSLLSIAPTRLQAEANYAHFMKTAMSRTSSI